MIIAREDLGVGKFSSDPNFTISQFHNFTISPISTPISPISLIFVMSVSQHPRRFLFVEGALLAGFQPLLLHLAF